MSGQNIVDILILLCVSCQAEEYKGEHAYYIMSKGDWKWR